MIADTDGGRCARIFSSREAAILTFVARAVLASFRAALILAREATLSSSLEATVREEVAESSSVAEGVGEKKEVREERKEAMVD